MNNTEMKERRSGR